MAKPGRASSNLFTAPPIILAPALWRSRRRPCQCYNRAVATERPQPDLDRLSTLAALLLLTYGLVRIIELPTLGLDLTLLGLVIPLTLNTRTVMLALAAALTVVGADWLAEAHPQAPQGRKAIEHWILPGLASFGSGVLLTRVPEGSALWIGLVVTAVALMAVFVAEFIAIDPDDPRRRTALVGLEALAYLLLLQITFSIRLLNLRGVFALPILFGGGAAIAWRLLRLRQPTRRVLLHGASIGWGLAQIGWALHYWPLPPLQGALILTLAFYIGLGLAATILEAATLRHRALEYSLIGLLGMVAILVLG